MRGILPGFTFAMLFVALAAPAEAGTLRTDFAKHLVPLEDIIPGGPPPDGIPAIDHPVFVAAAEADAWLKPPEPVLALDVNGDARAYPLRILIWQEIVNERLGRIQGRTGPPLDVPLASALSPAWRAGVPTPESGTMLAEWEKAARGDDGRIFLWGNHWDPERLNSAARGPGGTTPVNQYSGESVPTVCLTPSGTSFNGHHPHLRTGGRS